MRLVPLAAAFAVLLGAAHAAEPESLVGVTVGGVMTYYVRGPIEASRIVLADMEAVAAETMRALNALLPH